MSEFVFLYRGAKKPSSPEEGQHYMAKWIAWFKEMAENGHVVDRGQPLESEGKVVRTGAIVTDGPYAETKDLVGGFSLIRAADLNEAAELAKGCPTLERGGMVEVRPVMTLDM